MAATSRPGPTPIETAPSNLARNAEIHASLRAKFKDFDLPAVYDEVQRKAFSRGARNFVVQFGQTAAQIALDLDHDEIRALLKARRDEKYPVQWINVWDPSKQDICIDHIAEHYAFSHRLTKTIKYWDIVRKFLDKHGKSRRDTPDSFKEQSPLNDIEQAQNGQIELQHTTRQDKPGLTANDQAMFKLIQSQSNFTSIDQARGFLCIGANWLHNRPERSRKKPGNDHHDDTTLIPPHHWSWLSLCNDETVISFHEDLYTEEPPAGEDPSQWEDKEIRSIRSNTIKVLSQLSTHGQKLYNDANVILDLVGIRVPPKQEVTNPGDLRRQSTLSDPPFGLEGSSNLFYYLFEDYTAAVEILNKSKSMLQRLSDRVLASGNWKNKDKRQNNIIPRLHDLGSELRHLQHIFEGYQTLIVRMCAGGPATNDQQNMIASTMSLQAGARDFKLQSSAHARFERLNDRLQMLMLDTIKEYLESKDALSSTFFNLTAQKDSAATARLTRSATLLAKLSVFFLPISFMTSYFSVQIPDLTNGYTGTTYWVAFAVIASLSFLSLFFFSRLLMWVSEAMDDWAKNAGAWFGKNFRGGRGDGGEEKDAE